MALIGACALTPPIWALAQDERADPRPTAGVTQIPVEPQRLDHETMTALLGPVAVHLERGELGKARAGFERQLAAISLREGPQSMTAADHMMAFAVTSFIAQGADVAANDVLALMERALAIYTARLGREHREVALVLADIGTIGLELDPDDPSPRTFAALEESLRIRTIVLGRGHLETVTTLANVAEVRGLPSRTNGDPARIEASAAMFRQAIDDFGTQVVQPGSGAVTVRLRLARMYASNQLWSEAERETLAALADHGQRFAGAAEMCFKIRSGVERVVDIFAAAGRAGEEGRLRAALQSSCGDPMRELEQLLGELARNRQLQNGPAARPKPPR